MLSSSDPWVSHITVPAGVSPQSFLVGTDKYMRAELWHPGSTRTGGLQWGVEDLLTDENSLWAITQADYAATSQLTSGRPYSAAKMVKATLLPIPKNSQAFSYNSPAKLLDLHLPTTAQLLCMWRLLKSPHIPFNSNYDYILLTALSTFSWLAEAKLCSQLPRGHYLLESSRMVKAGEDRNFSRFPKMSICGQMLITSQGQR